MILYFNHYSEESTVIIKQTFNTPYTHIHNYALSSPCRDRSLFHLYIEVGTALLLLLQF